MAKFLADAFRRGGDRNPIRHVELERDGARTNLLCRSLAAREIARADQHREAVRHEFLCDLKSDSLIGPGDQRHAFVSHSNLLFLASKCCHHSRVRRAVYRNEAEGLASAK